MHLMMMKVAVFTHLLVTPSSLWDGKSLISLFVLLISINVRDDKSSSVGSLRISIFKQIPLFCHA